MKTQIVLGSFDITFFPVSPTKVRKSGRVMGGGPDSPRASSEPVMAGRISARRPARHDKSGLPASLEDWLVCEDALEICRRGCDGTKDGRCAWVVTAKPAARAKILPATIVRPGTAL
jgi:hypothetical protein